MCGRPGRTGLILWCVCSPGRMGVNASVCVCVGLVGRMPMLWCVWVCRPGRSGVNASVCV